MDNIIVIYKTYTGFTQRYAEWIAEELNCKALSVKDVSSNDLSNYRTIIYGGGIYAGQINGLKSFKNNIMKGKDNRLIIFATGAAPIEVLSPEDIMNANFPVQKDKIPFFYLQSGLNYDKMGIGHKIMMAAFRGMLKIKKNKTPEEQGMLNGIKKSHDFSRKEYINSLVEYIMHSNSSYST
ncbi:flavodoxin-like protein [Mobilisporobacter senegalensis]|uniref:Flavodoxin-like protein n=1 Tax=Mobilisporobacter senegalensis TaxID=1329262 RepID=A0A3N1XKA4_9FIRM|nr:flavodoxin domain-containing protein [Mobilisporobacter senegalensis]ROR27149.1 flavodoxin-like protein [Mobilisporobacter senegalensis]